jgi:hypothetical protein
VIQIGLVPARPERLLWIHGRALDSIAATQVDAANKVLIGQWQGPGITYYSTVEADARSDRLWLFLLQSGNQKEATEFNKLLKKHVAELSPLSLKRQVNLPTPLLRAPVGTGHRLDIGLHVVNDAWNGALMMFFYHEGRFYNPPHLQLRDMRSFAEHAKQLWNEAACTCYRSSSHCQDGCWECFQLHCERCQGTGWSDFTDWLSHGAHIDYRSGWPVALVQRETIDADTDEADV